MSDILYCIQCGNSVYELKGKTYLLCANCGWDLLTAIFGCVDDRPVSDTEKIDGVLDYVAYEDWSR